MEEFMSIPHLATNPIALQIVSLFDEKEEDEVNFRQFMKTLSIFHPKAPVGEKMKSKKFQIKHISAK